MSTRTAIVAFSLLVPARAFAEAPPALAAPDFAPASWLRLRTGLADVTGSSAYRPDSDSSQSPVEYTLLSETMTVSYAPLPSLAVVGSLSLSLLESPAEVFFHLDGGWGAPRLAVEWAIPVGDAWRLGAGAGFALGHRDQPVGVGPYPADLAAAVFVYDPTVAWSRSHHASLHAGICWQGTDLALTGDASVVEYFGRQLDDSQPVLQVTAGLSGRVSPTTWLRLEAMVLSDVLDEGWDEGYDVVPVALLGFNHRFMVWTLGLIFSDSWAERRDAEGQAGFGAMIELERGL